MASYNTLCESQAQCPTIPAEYFNQGTTINDDGSDNTELLITLTSFFGGYVLLFIIFIAFTLCRNKTSDSRYHQPIRLILITFTILIGMNTESAFNIL